MSERYQVIIKAGGNQYHFKTKTRVGSFQNFAEEMKTHVDWEEIAIALDEKAKMESVAGHIEVEDYMQIDLINCRHKQDDHCDCPCHKEHTDIMHYNPCCKFSGVKEDKE
jgi:hypothetical protein